MQKLLEQWRQRKIPTWLIWTVIGVAVSLFIVVAINFVLVWYFTNRTYPNTTVGDTLIGSITYEQDAWSYSGQILPETITASVDSATTETEFRVSELGLSLDMAAMIKQIEAQKYLPPLLEFFRPHRLDLQVTIDNDVFARNFADFQATAVREAKNAFIKHGQNEFVIEPEVPDRYIDTAEARDKFRLALELSWSQVALDTYGHKAEVTTDSLKSRLAELNQKLLLPISFTYGTKTYSALPSEVLSWYSEDGATLDQSKIAASIKEVGKQFSISVANASAAARLVANGLTQNADVRVALTAVKVSRSYTYCLNVKGVDAAHLTDLEAIANSALNDSRGWGMGGKVVFTTVESGCNFTIWLVSAPLMTSFGSGCDTTWSCTVKPNVLINFDRWTGGTSTFNAAGGSLEEYRIMAINHEVGHQLGFSHVGCGGAGQAAPVMMQQSYFIGGCLFNIWPSANEQAALRSKLGI